MINLVLRVNGSDHEVQIEEGAPLLYVLRNDLGLKGAKYGCGLEQCGACSVLVDGEAQFSCSTPAETFVGKEITTIEGIGTANKPHPIQRAFATEGVGQCGYCIPGTVVTVKALLDRKSNPDRSEIKEALSKNLCRCGCHHDVLKAVERLISESV